MGNKDFVLVTKQYFSRIFFGQKQKGNPLEKLLLFY